MNGMWKIGYSDGLDHKEPYYEDGPVAIIGIAAKDYISGYKAASRDLKWARNNRPPSNV